MISNHFLLHEVKLDLITTLSTTKDYRPWTQKLSMKIDIMNRHTYRAIKKILHSMNIWIKMTIMLHKKETY